MIRLRNKVAKIGIRIHGQGFGEKRTQGGRVQGAAAGCKVLVE
jgi:hypothetical protein